MNTDQQFVVDFEKSFHYPGEPETALSFFISNLTQLGFRIERKDSRSCELIGPGMRSTRQNPLLGISRIHLETYERSIKVRAEFGGARWMLRFMIFFVAGLGVVLLTLFGVLFRNQPNFRWWVPVLPFLPWPVLIPVIYRLIHRRTRHALDTLIHNLVMSSGR